MSDNVAITAGSGTSIATDEVTGTGEHVQVVKLSYGADGSRTSVTADADGLLVNLGANNDVTVTGTVTANLATGSNAIGKLAANSGVDIGDVDVTSTTTPANRTTSGTITANGQVVSLAVPGCATATIRLSNTWTGTLQLEGSPDGGVTYTTIPRIAPDTGTLGQSGFANSGTNGIYIVPCGGFTHVQVRASAWTSGTATIDWAASAGTQAVFIASEVKLASSTNNIGDVDVLTVPAPLSTTGNGSAATALRVSLANDSTGIVSLTTSTASIGKLAANSGVIVGDVNIVSNIPGTAATSLGKAIDSTAGATDTGVAVLAIRDDALTSLTPVDTDYAPLRVDDKGGLWVGGTAHDAADTGNSVKLGARADSSIKANTMVADADRTDLIADVDGQLLVKPLVPFTDIINERVSDTGGTSTAFSNFSNVASTRNYVTSIAVYNASATAGFVDFRDGTGGSVLFTMPLPAGGGSVISFPVPLRQPTVNTALAYDVSGALTTVYISLVGFQSKA